MVEQIAAAVTNESLGFTVLPGASNRNSNRAHARTLRGFQNLPLEGVLAIKDEKLRRGIVWEGLPKLLRDLFLLISTTKQKRHNPCTQRPHSIGWASCNHSRSGSPRATC